MSQNKEIKVIKEEAIQLALIHYIYCMNKINSITGLETVANTKLHIDAAVQQGCVLGILEITGLRRSDLVDYVGTGCEFKFKGETIKVSQDDVKDVGS